MIQIYDKKGNLWKEVLVTSDCVKTEELMTSDFIQLSWNDVTNEELLAGAYIIYKNEKYTLLNNYQPTRKNEVEWQYKPQFDSRIMMWSKLPFFLYTATENGTLEEPDWELTGRASDFMELVKTAIQRTTGEEWSIVVASDLTTQEYVHFDNMDILSALNAIANAFDTEWCVRKQRNELRLGKADFGSHIKLTVGKEIGIPQVTINSDGYFNRFYSFGSTRNITKEQVTDAPVNSIVYQRLTLSKDVAPNGYIDTEEGLAWGDGKTFCKTLYFNDIYPRATTGEENSKGLRLTNVRSRLMWVYKEGTDEKVQIGTDADGTPVYKMTAIWYFQLENCPTIEIIEGTTLMGTFERGALQGYEFELNYHDKAMMESNTTSGLPFQVNAGDFEICYKEENGITIPSTDGLVPADGDEISLINIKLPQEYIEIAQQELYNATMKEVAKMSEDNNTYSFKCNPVVLSNGHDWSVGRKVTFVDGAKQLSTRIQKISNKLDVLGDIDVTIGNTIKKGNITVLKEEVASANTNIDYISALNKSTQQIIEAYKRTQDAVIQSLAKVADMWKLEGDNVVTNYNVVSNKAISAKGLDVTEKEG